MEAGGNVVICVILVGWHRSKHGEVMEMKVLRLTLLLSSQEEIEELIFLSEVIMTW